MLSTVLATVVLAPLAFLYATVSAQGAATPLELAVVQQQFINAGIVPNVIPAFDPIAILNVTYPSPVGTFSTGAALEQSTVQTLPSFTGATTSPVSANDDAFKALYTAVMIDGNFTGASNTTVVVHYLQYDLTLVQTGPSTFTLSNSTAPYAPYLGPGPPLGTGAHRYIQLVYVQPTNFTPIAEPSIQTFPPLLTGFADFIQKSGLIGPLAGNYFTVENGTATVTQSPTSPVNPATVVVPTSTPARKRFIRGRPY